MFNLHYTCEQCFIKTGVMHTQQTRIMFNLHYTCEQCFIKTGVMHTQQLALCLICITPVNSVL